MTEAKELEGNILTRGGNSTVSTRTEWDHVDLPQMARTLGWKNAENMKWAMVKQVNMDTPLDERNAMHVDKDMTCSAEYPYAATRAGALQCSVMPWDSDRRKRWYASLAALTTLLAVVPKVI